MCIELGCAASVPECSGGVKSAAGAARLGAAGCCMHSQSPHILPVQDDKHVKPFVRASPPVFNVAGRLAGRLAELTVQGLSAPT